MQQQTFCDKGTADDVRNYHGVEHQDVVKGSGDGGGGDEIALNNGDNKRDLGERVPQIVFNNKHNEAETHQNERDGLLRSPGESD